MRSEIGRVYRIFRARIKARARRGRECLLRRFILRLFSSSGAKNSKKKRLASIKALTRD
jgi:hypothetical protein